MNISGKNKTLINRLFFVLRQAGSFFFLVWVVLTLIGCNYNESKLEERQKSAKQQINESGLLQLPDSLQIKQILDSGIETRKTNPDSALACFNEAGKLCRSVINNTGIHPGLKKVYTEFYIQSLIQKGLIFYFECDYDSSLHYFQSARTIAENSGTRWLLAESWFNIAEVYLELGNYDTADTIYNKSMQIYNACGDALSVLHCYNSLGIVYKLQGDYGKALEYYNKAFSIADSLNDNSCRAFVLNNIGNVYKSRGEFSKAMENFDRALDVLTESNELLPASDCLKNLGDISMETGNYQSAIGYYKNSLEIVEDAGDNYRKVALYETLGEIYTIISDFGQARNYFELAVSIAENIGDRVRLATCLKTYGKWHEKQGAFTNAGKYYNKALELATEFNNRKEMAEISNSLAANALQTGNISEALEFARKGYKISEEIGALNDKKQALKLLSDFYLFTGDSSKAFIYLRQFSDIKDTLAAISQLETIQTIETRHQLKEKENENLLLKAESETRLQKLKLNKTLFFASAFGLVLLSVIVFLFYKRMQVSRILFRQKEELNRSKVQELRNEIDYKNRELTSKALHLVQKDEIIGNISEKLQEISGGNGNANREIKSMIWEIKSDIQKTNWNEFEHHFLNVHPDFYQKLQESFPALTSNEKKICAFLKLNLKTKEISSITGQSVKSIEVARTRLRGKFNLHPDENLNAFIGSF